MIDLATAPFGVTYRQLWLPGGIRAGATMPRSVQGGQLMTLTGARKATTADVHFTGAAGSQIDCGVIHNAAAKLWISLRVKLDSAFAAGSVNQWVFGKYVDANNYYYAWFNTGNGTFTVVSVTGGVADFSVASAETSWTANTWYHLLFSLSSANGVRLRVNNGAAVTNASLAGAPNGAKFMLGQYADGGATGLIGTLSDVFVGTDDLTVNEESDLYKGFPPADAVNAYSLDEGRGTTANDRGSGANNGTLGAVSTWAFDRCRQPVLSLDAINDYAGTSAGVLDLSGAITVVLVDKVKSTYNAIAGKNPRLLHADINGTNYISLYGGLGTNLRASISGGGVVGILNYTQFPAIDDYMIFIITIVPGTRLGFYVNGSLADSAAWAGVMSQSLGRLRLGAESTPDEYDPSKPLFTGIIEGELTAKQVRDYSRWLNAILNLGISL